MIHVWNWLLNFTGINYGQNGFANHMYNFWSGFGSDISEFALIGTLLAIYRHHMKSSRLLNNRLVEILHKKSNGSHNP